MKRKKILIIFILFYFIINADSVDIVLIKGSNIYNKIFLFFFPFSKNYVPYFVYDKDDFIIELYIKSDAIINEPVTPKLFDTDVLIRIKNVPYNPSGIYEFPMTIRCNKKVLFTTGLFTTARHKNIVVLKGVMNDVKIKNITDKSYFKKRFSWNYPLHFDIRLQLNE